jgi:hypothetical protein
MLGKCLTTELYFHPKTCLLLCLDLMKSEKSWRTMIGRQKGMSNSKKLGETEQGLVAQTQILLCVSVSSKITMFLSSEHRESILMLLWPAAEEKVKVSVTLLLLLSQMPRYCIMGSVSWNHQYQNIRIKKKHTHSQVPVAYTVILATQEAEIRRIIVWSQPKQIAGEILSRKNPSLKKAGGAAQSVGPEFKSQTCQKRKNKSTHLWNYCNDISSY